MRLLWRQRVLPKQIERETTSQHGVSPFCFFISVTWFIRVRDHSHASQVALRVQKQGVCVCVCPPGWGWVGEVVQSISNRPFSLYISLFLKPLQYSTPPPILYFRAHLTHLALQSNHFPILSSSRSPLFSLQFLFFFSFSLQLILHPSPFPLRAATSRNIDCSRIFQVMAEIDNTGSWRETAWVATSSHRRRLDARGWFYITHWAPRTDKSRYVSIKAGR